MTAGAVGGGRREDVTQTLIAMERAALDRWGKGDPDGFLEISAPQVTYFDPFIGKRIDGLAALRRHYDGIRGQISIDRFELLNPQVEAAGDMAVLSFNFVSRTGKDEHRWNCSEVYRRIEGRWCIVQTHWSLTKK